MFDYLDMTRNATCEWFENLSKDHNHLPTMDEVRTWINDNFYRTFEVRDKYVKKFGFPLITVEAL